MTLFADFDPLESASSYATIEDLLTAWDRQPRQGSGSAYVYAFRDAAGSAFYVGKGIGNRAHDVEGHCHGRLGYYVAEFLGGAYQVEMLRTGLSQDDAEWLEAMLIEKFGTQLVNWGRAISAAC